MLKSLLFRLPLASPVLGLILAFGFTTPAGAVTITAADLTVGQSSVVLPDATVNAIGGEFASKSLLGVTGIGLGGGFTGGEIDISGESIEFVFDAPLILSSLDLSFLYAAPAYGDRVNEIAKVAVIVDGMLHEATLTVDTETTATWSLAGATVTNLSIASEEGAALWSVANPFGTLAVSSLTLLPVDASGDLDERNADYAFTRLEGDTRLPPVSEPGTLLLVGAGLAALVRRRA